MFYNVIVLAMTIASGLSSASTSDLNGWFSCYEFTLAEDVPSTSNVQDAECAIYKAPLCYPGICETPQDSSSKTLDVFVKRLPATSGDPKTATNAWLVQGGPGYSSTRLETDMVDLHQKLNGSVNVYTMDHRGTGRSSHLDCVAAESTTTGTPWGNDLTGTEALSCAKDLSFQYKNFSSFSVTSAATDIASFISKFTNKANTIVWGVSYGANVVERLIHLAPPEVTGYVLDSPGTSSGAPSADKFYSMSKSYDLGFRIVGEAFLALCEKDTGCKAHFQSKSLIETVKDLFVRFEKEPNSTCATILNQVTSNTPDGAQTPVPALRLTLGTLLMASYTRYFIPPLVYRLNRCAPKDVNVLNKFLDMWNTNLNSASEEDAYVSNVLADLIVFSEMWEIPAPSKAELKARELDTMFSDVMPAYLLGPAYCVFSKEKSKSCEEFGVGTYTGNPIMYNRDQYWNKSATIPKQASVLILSGKLDPQTYHKYAEYLHESIIGDNKELISFEYAAHAMIFSTNMIANDPSSDTCGHLLLASYVRNGGNLARLDKSCVKAMPAFNLTIPRSYLISSMGTDEAYDGEFINVTSKN